MSKKKTNITNKKLNKSRMFIKKQTSKNATPTKKKKKDSDTSKKFTEKKNIEM